MVSMYWYRTANEKYNGTFRQFCLDCANGKYNFPNSFNLYSIDDKVVVDYIGKYERLNEDFEYVCKKIGLPFKGRLTREKSDIREESFHFSTYYDDETKEIVRKHFSKEIDLFSYSF